MKIYRVWKYISKQDGDTEIRDYGNLPESDVKMMLKGYKYDSDMELWFSRSANFAYELKEV